MSASVVIMEKLEAPVADPTDVADYPIHFNLLNKVRLGREEQARRKSVPRPRWTARPSKDNNRVIDADFDRVVNEIYTGGGQAGRGCQSSDRWQQGRSRGRGPASKPLAIVYGEQERLINRNYAGNLAMPSLWRGELQVIPDAGHIAHWVQPL